MMMMMMMMMMMIQQDFAPQSSWAVVTGATRGIGRAIGEFDQSFNSCSNQIKSNQSTYYA